MLLRRSGTFMASLLPELPVRQNASARSAIELIEFDTNRGVQKSKLGHDFLSRFRRLRNIQQRREKIGKIEIQTAKSGEQFLNVADFGSNSSTRLFTCSRKLAPIHIHEGIRTRHLPNHIVGDPGALSELGQVELLDPAARRTLCTR
jgi:hypothetical protein